MVTSSMAPMHSTPKSGRVFSTRKKVRSSDATTEGRFRLDAVARIVSEVSEDDVIDLGRAGGGWWIARKIGIDVLREAESRQQLDCQTWAGGMARVAVQRRVSLAGVGQGCRYEVAATWIAIDQETKRPTPLPEWFGAVYGESCAGRRLSVSLTHDDPPETADQLVWPLRQVDFDQHQHVNNSSYWPVLEEIMANYEFDRTTPYRAEIEFRSGVPKAASVDILVVREGTGLAIWWQVGADIAASAILRHH